MRLPSGFVLACIFCAGCATAPVENWMPAADTYAADRDLQVLAFFLGGSWTSAEQAKEDKNFQDMRLWQVPIWTARAGEYWMYSELALAGSENSPARQRVYRFVARKGELMVLVYRLPGDPHRFAGEWKKEQPLAGLKPEDLDFRKGCMLTITRQMEIFFNGGTSGRDCLNQREGASYATTELSLTSATMRALERGFDAAGKQVWGPAKGAYDFRKISPYVR